MTFSLDRQGISVAEIHRNARRSTELVESAPDGAEGTPEG